MPKETTISLIAANGFEEAAAGLWERITDAWPKWEPSPRCLKVALDEFVSLCVAEEANPHGAALVVLNPADDVAICKVVDAMHQGLVPGVLLFENATEALRRHESKGVIVVDSEADPAFVSACLFSLSERQHMVRSLEQDLKITSRFQGGVHGEMDKIHEELNLAATVQQELLPKTLPVIDGLEFGVIYRPASYVSGDIYDVTELDEHHVGFFIADAVGHGVPAALLTMVISHSLRMTEIIDNRLQIITPEEAMSRLNDDIIRNQRGSPRFATAVYGVLNTQTRKVRITVAGHPPPLRIRPGIAIEVEAEGPLLGVFQGERYTATEFTLEEGETLLLYSDGFETAFPAPGTTGDQLRKGTQNYLKKLSGLEWPDASAGRGLTVAFDALEASLDEQTGSLHQVDDVTALAIAAISIEQKSHFKAEPKNRAA